jgi:hypothetical protein
MSEADVIKRVRDLIAKANDPASSANEKEQYLAAAHSRMKRHQIDMAMLDASRTLGEKRTPVVKVIQLFDKGYEWAPYFQTLIEQIARTNMVRVMHKWDDTELTIVGMLEDVQWTEMLWMNTFLEFVSRLDPRWDLNKSIDENIYVFKNAGYKWKDIWDVGYFKHPGGMPDGMGHFVPGKCKYMITGYKKMCALKGTEPVGTQTFAAYRHSFTRAFVDRIGYRLELMREAAQKAEDSVPGSAVALVDVKAQIDEEFYRLFEFMRPLTDEQRQKLRDEAKEARERDEAYLASLSPQDRKKVLQEREAEKRRQARANAQWYRQQEASNKKLRLDHAGYNSGRSAADQVNLSRAAQTDAAPTRKEIG